MLPCMIDRSGEKSAINGTINSNLPFNRFYDAIYFSQLIYTIFINIMLPLIQCYCTINSILIVRIMRISDTIEWTNGNKS